MKYAWQIDTDALADPSEPEGTNCNAKGLRGPRTASEGLLARLANREGRKFKVYDDDGELYYTGRIVFDDPACESATPDVVGNLLPETAFGPLWDFAGPNAGATEIRYRTSEGWKQL